MLSGCGKSVGRCLGAITTRWVAGCGLGLSAGASAGAGAGTQRRGISSWNKMNVHGLNEHGSLVVRHKSFEASLGNRTFVRKVHVPDNHELGFALITPKSMAKSHTGGIVARLLSTPGLNLVGARVLRPSDEFVEELREIVKESALEDEVIEPYEEALLRYVDQGFRLRFCELEEGIDNRVMLLLFSGENVRKELIRVIGENVPNPKDYGETIRGTYGDYSLLEDGTIVTFEPSVLTSHTEKSNKETLELLARYCEKDGEIVETPNPSDETVLVMIKPDNFTRPSSLPGHIIDQFGQTGLQIVGARVYSMTLSQAREFYGFLEDIFVEKLKGSVEKKLKAQLQNSFEFGITEDDYAAMTEILKKKHAHHEVNTIIHYMTGVDPEKPTYSSSRAICFGLLFRGPDAVNVIRTKLGSTDPKKAQAGTVRSDYGHDLMRNGAHASDSVASALRERKIVGLLGREPSPEKVIIENWLARQK